MSSPGKTKSCPRLPIFFLLTLSQLIASVLCGGVPNIVHVLYVTCNIHSAAWVCHFLFVHMSKAPFVVVWHVPVSIDLGPVATTNNVMASGVLFHKGGRRHHVCCNSSCVLVLPCTMQWLSWLAVTFFTMWLCNIFLLPLISALLLPCTMQWWQRTLSKTQTGCFLHSFICCSRTTT
jgi:hypothetical protein